MGRPRLAGSTTTTTIDQRGLLRVGDYPKSGAPLSPMRRDGTFTGSGLRYELKQADGLFHLPTGPGLGLQINEADLAKRRVPIA